MQGIVVHYNKEKGYGFIEIEEQKDDIFIHHSKITNASELSQGQSVEFQLKKTSTGLSAINLVAGAKQRSPYLIFGVLSLFVVLTISTLLYEKIQPILTYLIAINITTFLLYGYDKLIAGGEKLRVPEYNLHALALLGGSPSGLFAQKLFRHKTIKGSFQLVYWLIVLAQIGLLYWLSQI
jgi:uncharacterized membrane protein YsdA (DUF1294 family)/cold shock CspA family protein